MKIQHNIKALFKIENCLKCLLLLAGLVLYQTSAFALTVEMEPRDISIGFGYHGSELVIKGQRATDEEVIIKISSPSIESVLKYKGKAAGVFWMKLGDMVFKPVPMVYYVYAPDRLTNLLAEESLMKHGLGYEALSSSVEIESSQSNLDKSYWIAEFIKYKEHEQLYHLVDTAKQLPTQAGDQYQYRIDWPFQASPGSYRLEAYAVKDQQVVDHVETEFTVKQGGFVAFLSGLAFNNAVLYGLGAILVASLAGFSVGLIFKGGGAH